MLRRVVEEGTPQGNHENNHGSHRDDASGTGVLGVQKGNGQAGGVRSDTASGDDMSEDDEPDDWHRRRHLPPVVWSYQEIWAPSWRYLVD